MAHFEIYNEQGELIVSESVNNLGTLATETITTLKQGWYANSTLQAPAWFDKQLGIPGFAIVDNMPMGIFKFNEGGCACGADYYSANSGTMYWIGENYSKTLGYLDIYDEQGSLIWSAESAAKVPRVTNVINLTAQQITNGVTIDIGDQLVMMNNMPSIMRPGPINSLTVGGMYMKFSNGKLTLQFKIRTNNSVGNYVNNAYGVYGLNVYLYTFGSDSI